MFTYEQAPFIKLTAKKALSEGVIDHDRYNEIMNLLDELENSRVIFDQKMINQARIKILRSGTFAYSG